MKTSVLIFRHTLWSSVVKGVEVGAWQVSGRKAVGRDCTVVVPLLPGPLSSGPHCTAAFPAQSLKPCGKWMLYYLWGVGGCGQWFWKAHGSCPQVRPCLPGITGVPGAPCHTGIIAWGCAGIPNPWWVPRELSRQQSEVIRSLLLVISIKKRRKEMFCFTFTFSFSYTLALCRSECLTDVVFLLWKTSFNISCQAGLLATNSLHFFMSEKAFLLHFWGIISQGTELWDSLFFQHFKDFTLFLYTKYLLYSSLHGFWGDVRYNSYLCSSTDFFSFGFFQDFFFFNLWFSLVGKW